MGKIDMFVYIIIFITKININNIPAALPPVLPPESANASVNNSSASKQQRRNPDKTETIVKSFKED